MTNNHEHSAQIIEREDVNGGPALEVDDGLKKIIATYIVTKLPNLFQYHVQQ